MKKEKVCLNCGCVINDNTEFDESGYCVKCSESDEEINER